MIDDTTLISRLIMKAFVFLNSLVSKMSFFAGSAIPTIGKVNNFLVSQVINNRYPPKMVISVLLFKYSQ